FTENNTFAFRQREIRERFGIRPQARAICFVVGEALERDQSPRHIVRAFVRHKVTDKMTATAWNDAAPVLSISFEYVSLERIDLIANDTGDHFSLSSKFIFYHCQRGHDSFIIKTWM